MPEGDTIHRSAVTLQRWLAGRVVSSVERSPRLSVDLTPLLGGTVERVGAHGKHLLVHVTTAAGPLVLRTHNRMTGSWHVYPVGASWRRPRRQATLVLRCGDREAVLFNAPDVELVPGPEGSARVDGTGHLGPDVLATPLALDEILRRAERAIDAAPELAVGELLLDQRVVAGIGNIYRCEVLFIHGVNPWHPAAQLDREMISALMISAHTVMSANLRHDRSVDASRDFGGGPGRAWVYGRAGRRCRRCDADIRSRPQGRQARVAWWCPGCQPLPDNGLARLAGSPS